MEIGIFIPTITVVYYLEVQFLSRGYIPGGRYTCQKAVDIIIKLTELTHFNRVDIVFIATQHEELFSGGDGKAFGEVIGQISILYRRRQVVQYKGIAVFIKRLTEMVRELLVDISYNF